MKVLLITGSNGFIGKNLLTYIEKHYPDYKIKTISTTGQSKNSISYNNFISNNYDPDFLNDVTDVVHLAAIAHKFNMDDQTLLNEINVEYPSLVLKTLKDKRLEKFIFLSSISVSLLAQGIVLDTKVYAETKKAAESALMEAQQGSNVDLVILRPPMVYGRNAPGNFAKLIKLLKLPLILPFGKMNFHKPCIHVMNLASTILTIVSSQNIKQKVSVYEVSDPFSVNFNEFIRKMCRASGGHSLLFPLPLGVLKFLLKIVGKSQLYDKLSLTYKVSNLKLNQDFNCPMPITKETMFSDL